MTIKELWRYPVKSMAGERISGTWVRANGFLGDRRYALVDTETSEVICAKVPRKWGKVMNFGAEYVEEPVAGERMPALRITFPDGSVHFSDSPRINSLLSAELGRSVELTDTTTEPAASEALWQVVEGHEATDWTRQRTIGRVDNQDLVRWQLAEGVPAIGDEETFFDLAPMHVLTTGTLRHFQELAPGISFDARRFRPNIVIDVAGNGFVEQGWVGQTMRIGEAGLLLTIPVPRCAMPTLEQRTFGLSADRKVMQAVARHNTHEVEALGPGRWAIAGVYANSTQDGYIDLDSRVHLEEAAPEIGLAPE
ncbi:MOSC domain-containing protein [Rhodococcus erythropolis]|uniref:MOSC domain-containing protein n=1 Tax=Rhodococcus erythropolis TaxID=1833 RepID=UPI001C9B6315|nr:MOSC N-terminal beta barrel domain-containing protein [Rhodococcus erythropolis]MBY6382493.1 MOSC domain-containing protein [Rhodococcus erythropolis]